MSILRTTVNDSIITQERVPYHAAHISVQKDYIIHQGNHITLMKTEKLTLANSCWNCSLLISRAHTVWKSVHLLLLCGIVSPTKFWSFGESRRQSPYGFGEVGFLSPSAASHHNASCKKNGLDAHSLRRMRPGAVYPDTFWFPLVYHSSALFP